MKMMKQSIKRMALTGAAVTVMMGLTAPAAMAQEVRDHRDGSAEAGPIVRDHRDGSGGILCEISYIACDDPPPYDVGDPVVPPPVVNVLPTPSSTPVLSTVRFSPGLQAPLRRRPRSRPRSRSRRG
jgi:hypothetical protein